MLLNYALLNIYASAAYKAQYLNSPLLLFPLKYMKQKYFKKPLRTHHTQFKLLLILAMKFYLRKVYQKKRLSAKIVTSVRCVLGR